MRSYFLLPLLLAACSATNNGVLDGAVGDLVVADLAPVDFVPAPLDTAGGASAAATAQDGTIYVVGGVNIGSAFKSALAYHPNSNSWTSLPAMRQARNAPAAAVAPDGRLIVFGGRDSNRMAVATVEIYTPSANA